MPFGLKVAPSFQKATMKIFAPLLHTCLIYIDDILLLLKDKESHIHLLRDFADIIHTYGIMLSEKKMQLGQTKIDFLGMVIVDGKYDLQPHIANELRKFPDVLTTKKEIQQFLVIANNMSSFIPNISHVTTPLSQMHKKNPPSWSEKQTNVVKSLKCRSFHTLPLKIPYSRQRILQMDTSDTHWGAMLFEQDDDKV
ncbi:uncharacterized protein K02A2.6-like [Pistacia vera]|uniref:uncharacterized protein K02A2.6-like n=1 Tax=Pistacia vera TaxID=55513 RepID=UPI0012639D81|nr:uncharacterized protein K02A2.6-like [Pistacia vera]